MSKTYTKVNLAFEHEERDTFKAALERYNHENGTNVKQQHIFKAVAELIVKDRNFIKELPCEKN